MAKPTTAWQPQRPGTLSVSTTDVLLTTEASVSITTQALVALIINPITFVPKPTTVWGN